MKTAAIVAKLAPYVGPEVDLAALIDPIMHAEAQIYTPKREAAARQHASAAIHPPLVAHPRELGKRLDGSTAFAYDSPPAYPGEARVAGGPVLPEERPRMTPPLLQCDPCVRVRLSEKNKGSSKAVRAEHGSCTAAVLFRS